MERIIINQLSVWKDSCSRKPLVLTGVRQCGKTFILKEFGKSCFEDFVYLNFEKQPSLSSLFEYDFDVKRIIDELESTVLGKKITVGKTLVIFDEIQACPKAISSLKYFCEDLRELHLVAAGSLLGVALKSQEISFPVGKVDRISMYPMTFYEFVKADGGENLLKGLEKYDLELEIPALYTEPLKKYLSLYYIVGGMPEAVKTWVETHNFDEVEQIQNAILRDYSDDFSKHAPLSDIPKMTQIWDSVPNQLAKENSKFIFSHVKEGARSKDLEDALEWLVNAGLVYKLERVEKAALPLQYAADATYFKVYMADIGLLRSKAHLYYKTILEGSSEYAAFKGAIAENYVLNELRAQEFPLWFWRSGNEAEVDVLSEYKGNVIPFEVKSADNTQAKSFKLFLKRYSPKIAFKSSLKNAAKNIENETTVFNIPLYLIFKMTKILDDFLI